MSAASAPVWIITLVLLIAAVALAVVAPRVRRPLIGVAGLVPLGLIGLGIAFDVMPPAPSHALAVVTALVIAALGVAGGGPAASATLDFATQPDVQRGAHGGIMILPAGPHAVRKEVLRGGAAIGYLERIAIVAAIALGHVEIVAAVIAVKGLGRFSELDSAEARERFIIGTLASLIWSGACGILIVLLQG